jgi:hypothetical protein
VSTVGIVSGRGVFIAPAAGTGEWRFVGYTTEGTSITGLFQPQPCEPETAPSIKR